MGATALLIAPEPDAIAERLRRWPPTPRCASAWAPPPAARRLPFGWEEMVAKHQALYERLAGCRASRPVTWR